MVPDSANLKQLHLLDPTRRLQKTSHLSLAVLSSVSTITLLTFSVYILNPQNPSVQFVSALDTVQALVPLLLKASSTQTVIIVTWKKTFSLKKQHSYLTYGAQ